jgi:hypothetical protein
MPPLAISVSFILGSFFQLSFPSKIARSECLTLAIPERLPKIEFSFLNPSFFLKAVKTVLNMPKEHLFNEC